VGAPLQTFLTPQEVRAACSQLDPDCVFELEQYENVVGPYRFAPLDWVLCQMKKKHGPCNTEHGHGWVIVQKGGKQVYVGNCCARDYLAGAVAKFGTDVNRVRKEQRVGHLKRRLAFHLGNAGLPERIRALSERQRGTRKRLAEFRDLWPLFLVRRLQDISRTGNNSVRIEVKFLERDEEDKVRSKWEPRELGSITDVGVMNVSSLHDVATRLTAAEAALREAAAGEQSERKLKKWVDILDAVDGCEADLELVPKAIEAFQRPENLKLLCWCVRSDADQLEVVLEVLRIISPESVSRNAARRTLNDWKKEICTEHNAQDLRVP
jgi:hypothetical protein